MAKINISDLNPAGADLFLDSESFMSELTDEELYLTKGGFSHHPHIGAGAVIVGAAIVGAFIFGAISNKYKH